MVLMLSTHPSRSSDLMIPDELTTKPALPCTSYLDGFGNHCHRITAPAGYLTITAEGIVRDDGLLESANQNAAELPVEELPKEVLVFLLGSRYCEVDVMTNAAWNLFGHVRPGWTRVQAICDYVNNHIQFGYQNARSTRTAAEAYVESVGVCRDFAHLAITFCRCMNIPARYCTGYLGDIGVPPAGPMDWAAWFEAYIGGEWQTFDPRNNVPRIGRILMARGRDAADVAISTSFGPARLQSFAVTCEEMQERGSGSGEGVEQYGSLVSV